MLRPVQRPRFPDTVCPIVPILISCESAGTRVPEVGEINNPSLARSIELLEKVDSRGGADPYGGAIAEQLANLLNAQLVSNVYRSDLIDVSHSIGHRDLFGPESRRWSQEAKDALIEAIYAPYRLQIETAVERLLNQFTYMIHLSVQTFELRNGDKIRRTDVGLLYDPARSDELDLCIDWIDEAYDRYPNLRIRRNYPRRGTIDSLTKSMRQRFRSRPYLGVELWLNRAWAARDVRLREEAIEQIAASLQSTIGINASEAA